MALLTRKSEVRFLKNTGGPLKKNRTFLNVSYLAPKVF